MQRNGWILSVLGAAGLTFGHLQAGDPLAEQLTPPTTDARRSLFLSGSDDGTLSRAPSRYRRGVESELPESDLRNYYRELFGEQPSSLKNADPLAQKVPPSPAVDPNNPLAPQSASGPSPISFGPAPSRLQPKAEAAPQPADASNGSVIHAAFQRDSGAGTENEIQQVRGQQLGPSARPFPSSSGSGSASVEPVEAAERTLPTSASPGAPAEPAAVERLPASGQPTSPAQQPVHLQPHRQSLPQASLGQPVQTSSSELMRPISIDSATPTPPVQPRGGLMLTGGASAESTGTTGISPVSHTERHSAPADDAGQIQAAEAAITLKWKKRGELSVGQECTCELLVTNSGQSPAEEIGIEAFFPKTLRLTGADPKPTVSTDFLGWQIDSLSPGQQRTITVRMIPLERGDVGMQARVRFSGRSSSTFNVSEPMLALKVEGPSEVTVGEPASHKIVVSNPGTGVAVNVRLLALIPKGLEHAGGERIELTIGSLNPGESRPVSLPLIATDGGRHLIEIQARAEAGLTRTAASEVAVIAPSLQAAIRGPGLRYVGRQAVYTISVNNNGAAPTDNVRVMYKVPQGLSFVSSDRGTQYDAASRLLSWFVGRLEKGQTSQLNVTLSSDQIGEFSHLVRATSEYGATSDAQLKTSVEGTPSLSVEVADLDDPVEVGAAAAYEVRVKNEGSAPAKNVALTCELSAGMEFRNAAGPGKYALDGSGLRFEPIPLLAPGEMASFRVIVTAGSAGNLRMKAHLSSESIAEPLTAEELTKFYGE